MATYCYQPLKHREVRFLDLSPGVAESPLAGSIVHVFFGLSSDYEALSYTWGVGQLPQTILCDGGNKSITFELYSALRRLRDPIQTRRLW